MSSFECSVVRVVIEPHPGADSIEIARVGGYMSIVKKGQFKTGDLAVYIPEQAVLPYSMLKEMGFWDAMNNKGTLSSSAGNRVRAIKLRGVLSQGLLLDGAMARHNVDDDGERTTMDMIAYFSSYGVEVTDPTPTRAIKWFKEGDDAAKFLGIVKWEPVIPMHLQGKVAGGDLDATIAYDFEALKKNPDLFDDGMLVSMTEKLHGTLICVGLIPECIWAGKSWAEKCSQVGNNGFKGVVTSKGMGAKGLMLDPSDQTNLYIQAAQRFDLWNKLEKIRCELGHPNDMPMFIFGEVFGVIQTQGGPKDIQTGMNYGQYDITFRAFDIYAGTRSNGFYMNDTLFRQACGFVEIQAVPELYRGFFNMEKVKYHTDGNTTLTKDKHIREGIVIKALDGSSHPVYGRRIAKSVSAAYLTRKGESTEYS